MIIPLTDLSLWTTATGTFSFDATNGAMKVVTDGSGGTASAERSLLLDGYATCLTFDVLADANLSAINVGFMVRGAAYATTSFARNNVMQAGGTYPFRAGVRHKVSVPLAMLAANGSSLPSESDLRKLTGIRFEFKDAATGASTVYVGNLRIHKAQLPPGICWVFDDNRWSTYQKAYPILAANDYIGVIPVITGQVATVGNGGATVGGRAACEWANLVEMQTAGWELINHSRSHTNLSGASAATAKSEVINGYTDLLANGADPEGASMFVYPGGGYDSTTLPVVEGLVGAARTVLSNADTANGHKYEQPHLGEKARLRTLYVQSGITSVAVIEAVIDRLAARGAHSIFTFHEIADTNPGSDSLTFLTSDFQTVVEYAAGQGLASYTMSDLWGRS